MPEPENVYDPVGFFSDFMMLPDEKILFHVIIRRHGQTSDHEFQIDQRRLTLPDREQLLDFLGREQLQLVDKAAEVRLIVWLWDIALQQQGILDKEVRDKEVQRLMLYGSKPSAPIPPTREGFGVSPSLIFISRRVRNRLWRRHRIDVDELQRESEQLYRDVERFWEVIPPEPIPQSNRYFSYAAKKFDELAIVHHEKVRRVGELVGGELGKVLVGEAQLMIKGLTAQLVQNEKDPDP